MRLIFDSRVANTDFVDPLATGLPTASAFSIMEAPEAHMYIAQGDLANACYCIEIDAELGEKEVDSSISVEVPSLQLVKGVLVAQRGKLPALRLRVDLGGMAWQEPTEAVPLARAADLLENAARGTLGTQAARIGGRCGGT